jgi:zinc transport system substrate-binding protein/manganese/iron transport system substrate-binding protein
MPRHPLHVALLLLSLGFATATPSVVVSIHPLFDIVRQVAGEHAAVVRILPPGASPHTFDPTPRDVLRIARADLIVMNGGLDLWLQNLVAASGNRAPLVEVIAEPSVQTLMQDAYPDLVTSAEGGSALAFNPHVWLDPPLMAEVARLVAEALADLAPEHAAAYRANAERVAAELHALDAELRVLLADIAGAPFVPFHDAWPYFAARYGLDLIVEIEPFPGREPSPAYLRYALGLIRASGASAIFSEAQLNRRPAEVVAAEAGVALFELDPLGGLPGREGYAQMMRFNAAVIRSAFP